MHQVARSSKGEALRGRGARRSECPGNPRHPRTTPCSKLFHQTQRVRCASNVVNSRACAAPAGGMRTATGRSRLPTSHAALLFLSLLLDCQPAALQCVSRDVAGVGRMSASVERELELELMSDGYTAAHTAARHDDVQALQKAMRVRSTGSCVQSAHGWDCLGRRRCGRASAVVSRSPSNSSGLPATPGRTLGAACFGFGARVGSRRSTDNNRC